MGGKDKSARGGLSIGAAGMSQIRNSWDLSVILGAPFSRWGAIPYIVHPVPFPSGILPKIVVGCSDHSDLWGRLLGDTADRISDHASGGVLVVKN